MTRIPLRLLLVDADPLFRLGLRTWLEQTAGYRVVAETGQAQEVLALVRMTMEFRPLGLEDSQIGRAHV